MNNDILKGQSTNIFVVMFKTIWKGFRWYFAETPLGGLSIIIAVAVGSLYITYKDFETENPKGKYEMTYRVYYSSNNVKEYTIKHDYPIKTGVSNNANYVKKYRGGVVIETTAPIEVVRYVNYDKNDK